MRRAALERIAFALVLATAGTVGLAPRSSAQPTPPGAEAPPPPPTATPPPPPLPPNLAVPAPPPVPQGQWVYTPQYGWVWMPYGDDFTWVSPPGNPFMYLYAPLWGWGWVAAPWLLGVGPTLYFGSWGHAHYAWFGHPHWRRHPPKPPRGFYVVEPRGRYDHRGGERHGERREGYDHRGGERHGERRRR